MRVRWLSFPVLILALAIVSPPAADAQERGYPFSFKNFSIELYGGYSNLNPGDLNGNADYEEAYLQFYYVQRFDYFHSIYGDNYTFENLRTGDERFKTINHGFPLGARIRYAISPTLSFSIGAQYLRGTQNSRSGMIVDVQDSSGSASSSPNLLTYEFENSGFGLSASAWLLQAGAHFGWDVGSKFRVEIYFVGGPMFARCRFNSERHSTMTDQTGFRSENVASFEMNGSATGASAELGGQIRLKTVRFLDIFLEGSFAFSEASGLRGPGSSQTIYEDSNTGQNVSSDSWNRQWSIPVSDVKTAWGRFRASQAGNASDFIFGSKRFVLSLSRFQLKAGIAVRL